MQNQFKRRVDPHQAFLRCQTHMIATADAYIDQVTLGSFIKAIDNCKNPATKKMLNTLCDLYALTNIHDNKGWFLESDYMEGSKTKKIRQVISKLYQDIRPNALKLVDAFGIPEEMLGAEIVM